MSTPWTQAESAYLVRTAPRSGFAWCASQLGRSERECRERYGRLVAGAGRPKAKPGRKASQKPEKEFTPAPLPLPLPDEPAEAKRQAAHEAVPARDASPQAQPAPAEPEALVFAEAELAGMSRLDILKAVAAGWIVKNHATGDEKDA